MSNSSIRVNDLQSPLNEQLGVLEQSAALFDEGYENEVEVKRLAATLRVLLYGPAIAADRRAPEQRWRP